MGAKSEIAWTEATWNPVTGCSHMSPGCNNCYAESLSRRRYKAAVSLGQTPEQIRHAGWTEKPWGAQNAVENVICHLERLDLPLRWRQPKRIFVNSMSDLFHERVSFDFIAQVFGVMALAPHHMFQVLTKRPERMRQFMAWMEYQEPTRSTVFQSIRVSKLGANPTIVAMQSAEHLHGARWGGSWPAWPLPNVWLGVSVEDQRRADERIPLLLETTAAVRFLSCEPILGPIDLRRVGMTTRGPDLDIVYGWLTTYRFKATGSGECSIGVCSSPQSDKLIDWVICGGESGPKHRPMDLDWARQLRDACVAARVPFFFKQSNGVRPGMGRELDGRRWEEFPDIAGVTR